MTEVFVSEIEDSLGRLRLEPNAARVDLIHALFVGLSIIDLATGRPNGEERANAVLKLAFRLLRRELK